MSDVKWIKIAADMFDNRKIKQIRTLPDGDAIIVIWLQILCLAGQINNGGCVHFTKDLPYTDEMLATQFDRPVNTIRLALATFQSYNMIEIVDSFLLVSNWEKYQSTDKLKQIQEQNRARQQKFKEKQKLLPQNNVKVTLPITLGNATDIELDKDKDNKTLYSAPANAETPNEQENEEKFPLTKFVETCIGYLNTKANTHYKATTPKTIRLIQARLNEGFEPTDFQKVIDVKCKKWLGDKQMQQYLRPDTLFGTKFESYLNEKVGR